DDAGELEAARVDRDGDILRRISAAPVVSDEHRAKLARAVRKRPFRIRIRRRVERAVADAPDVLDRITVGIGAARQYLDRAPGRGDSDADAASIAHDQRIELRRAVGHREVVTLAHSERGAQALAVIEFLLL